MANFDDGTVVDGINDKIAEDYMIEWLSKGDMNRVAVNVPNKNVINTYGNECNSRMINNENNLFKDDTNILKNHNLNDKDTHMRIDLSSHSKTNINI